MIPPLSNYIKRPLDADLEDRVSSAEQAVSQIDSKVTTSVTDALNNTVLPQVDTTIDNVITTEISSGGRITTLVDTKISDALDWEGIED